MFLKEKLMVKSFQVPSVKILEENLSYFKMSNLEYKQILIIKRIL